MKSGRKTSEILDPLITAGFMFIRNNPEKSSQISTSSLSTKCPLELNFS